MSHGICTYSCIPARKEASHSSEMSSQLLFGEHYKVLKQNENWIQILTSYDHYECWIHARQHESISEKEFHLLEKQTPVLCSDLVASVYEIGQKISFPVSMGAVFPLFNNNEFRINSRIFRFDGSVRHSGSVMGSKDLLNTAMQFLNTPYLWGGRSPFGIDCSGFSQLVFRMNGYSLPRDAYQQVEKGKALVFAEEAEAGDLAFFDNEEGRIVHVGILLNNHQIIHASGSVRIDKFDHYGIYNTQTKSYSHTLRVIKRLL